MQADESNDAPRFEAVHDPEADEQDAEREHAIRVRKRVVDELDVHPDAARAVEATVRGVRNVFRTLYEYKNGLSDCECGNPFCVSPMLYDVRLGAPAVMQSATALRIACDNVDTAAKMVRMMRTLCAYRPDDPRKIDWRESNVLRELEKTRRMSPHEPGFDEFVRKYVRPAEVEFVTMKKQPRSVDVMVSAVDATAERPQCPVCLLDVDADVARLRACGHAFHTACIDAWLANAATCPVCRADVSAPPPSDPYIDARGLSGLYRRPQNLSIFGTPVFIDNDAVYAVHDSRTGLTTMPTRSGRSSTDRTGTWLGQFAPTQSHADLARVSTRAMVAASLVDAVMRGGARSIGGEREFRQLPFYWRNVRFQETPLTPTDVPPPLPLYREIVAASPATRRPNTESLYNTPLDAERSTRARADASRRRIENSRNKRERRVSRNIKR